MTVGEGWTTMDYNKRTDCFRAGTMYRPMLKLYTKTLGRVGGGGVVKRCAGDPLSQTHNLHK